MKNTIKNKELFFALYYKQNVYNEGELIKDCKVYPELAKYKNSYLLLKPVKFITDEDVNAIGLHKTSLLYYFDEEGESVILNNRAVMFADHYLRSKGFALPWMNISVEEMIEFNWIKLKINETN
jgi:hypothetical protein